MEENNNIPLDPKELKKAAGGKRREEIRPIADFCRYCGLYFDTTAERDKHEAECHKKNFAVDA